ncbi:ABC transporter substrate-binding protein [Mesorhizobium retamae]|uniref:ABC transporter substrate-binding protein n=1 Tax=Mesorhizobium retamae TaxID=2912854 RepID=A0ABS9QDA5_9HYPH|nr:ABC transporter substrate-binding protein [Mesorhizobium sp. IRAMC:0171]MCG7505391.1 ABC transporter substrate-binding protein [Mesorhizobium sp. IRAMC:0171]
MKDATPFQATGAFASNGTGSTRRDILKFVGGLAVGLPVIGSSDFSSFVSKAFAAGPSGLIRLATSDVSPGDSLDPHRQLSFTDAIRSYFVYEKLTEIGPNGELLPQLAKSWSSDPTAKVWTFELDPGATFHNGKPLKSSDVVYSFRRVAAKATASPGAAFAKNIAEVAADGDSTVRVTLTSSDSEFPIIASIRYFAVVEEGVEDFTSAAVGTGPWKLSSFEPGISAEYVRNDNYRIKGLPLLSKIESFGIGDESARLNALLSDSAEVIQGVNAKAVERVRKSSSAQVLLSQAGATATFPMHVDKAPFDNPKVRKALKLAFDREEFVKIAFGGIGTAGCDHPIPPGDPFCASDLPLPRPDKAEVVRLLTEAGHADTTFELHTSDANYGGADAAVVLAELMGRNGVKVKVTKHPSDSYWSTIWNSVPWCASSWTVRPSAISRIETGYVSGAPQNETGWTSPEVDQLIVKAKSELDPAKRKALLAQAQKIIADDGGTIVGAFVPWIDGYSTKVTGLVANPILFAGSGLWTKVQVAAS